jgi:hypothetical protein
LDAYITGFEKALDEGKVRLTRADLDRLVRLKGALGNADSPNPGASRSPSP